jgi:hypothetical protein
MFTKLVVVDTHAHLLGRLASMIAKELLSGQQVVRFLAQRAKTFLAATSELFVAGLRTMRGHLHLRLFHPKQTYVVSHVFG